MSAYPANIAYRSRRGADGSRWMRIGRLLAIVAMTGAYGSARADEKVDSRDDQNWPSWRGANTDGIASPDQSPPTKWSETENILWRTEVPGSGHSSPTVYGDYVFIATADPKQEEQLVLAFDRATGKRLWQTVVHRGGFENKNPRGLNEKATHASSTIATDGQRVFINFINDSAAWTTAIDFKGQILWQQRLTDYVIHQGYGSSPLIYRDLVIVSADNKSGGAVVALDRRSGDIVWRRERPEKPNYASPVIVEAAGQTQLIFTGCDRVTSLDPSTGQTHWEIEGSTTECVTTAVSDGTHVFTSGGYPRNHLSAVVADGSGDVAWDNNIRNYVPSMLVHEGHLYATLDAGIATCFRCSDGKQLWKGRLGGTFSSSPVLVGKHIYATNEEGITHIFKATPEGFEKVSENRLGDTVFATPAICNDVIYMRVTKQSDDDRQDYLYAIGRR